MGKITFLDNFEAAFDGLERERYEQVAHAVPYHCGDVSRYKCCTS